MKCSVRAFTCLITLLLLLILIDPASSSDTDRQSGISAIYKAAVHITAMQKIPLYATPWVMLPENRVFGSGCVIPGEMILTNAHVVANHTSIMVRKFLDSREYPAKVLFVSHEADLALLSVDDGSFFSGVVPLKIADLPVTPQKVFTLGYPNGESFVVTEGTLFNMEYQKYIHSNSYLPAGEILSEVRPGSSGGPVIYDSKIVGVVMQANKSGSVAHVIPGQVINHFLTDISDGRHDGFPDLGLLTADSSPNYRNGNAIASGIAVRQVIAGSPAEPFIQKDDVVLSVDGVKVYDDGTIDLGKDGHLPFIHLIKMRQIGDKVSMSIRRAGAVKTLSFALNKRREDFALVPEVQYDVKPRYFIFGGIIFSPLTMNIFKECTYVPEDIMKELVNVPTSERKEIVVALQVLPSDINNNYHDLQNWKITAVNGKRFRDFSEFYRLVMYSSTPSVEFSDDRGFKVVIDRQKADESHSRIMKTFSIREDCSPDVRALSSGSVPF